MGIGLGPDAGSAIPGGGSGSGSGFVRVRVRHRSSQGTGHGTDQVQVRHGTAQVQVQVQAQVRVRPSCAAPSVAMTRAYMAAAISGCASLSCMLATESSSEARG